MAWPTTNDPKTEFATMRFTKSEMADVDLWADTLGSKPPGNNRSEFIRNCVARVIAAEKKKARLAGSRAGAKPGGRVDEGAHDD